MEVGNLSAPWLAIGFLSGASQRRTGRAGTAGVLATLAALVGFYAQQSPLADRVDRAGAAVSGDHVSRY